MAGEYLGRVAVYNRDFTCSSNQAIAKVSLKENVNPYYVSTFLNTKFGQNQINRLKTITGQPNINMSLIKCLIVPTLSPYITEKVESIIKKSEQYIASAVLQYSEAEDVLLNEFGLKNWKPKELLATEKTFADFLASGRFDAEYYQPKYDELFKQLNKYKTKSLGQIIRITKSIEPGSDAYQESGIPFIRVANLSKYGLSESDIYLDRTEYCDVIKPKKDTILLSKDGSVGIAYKVQQDLDAITSGAILHLIITDNDFLPDYITLVLNSIIVKMQAERDAGGSIIQHWKPSEIEQVVIPKLGKDIQQQIGVKIEESFALRTESKRLLELAKTAVEVAIEQGENKAIELLNNAKLCL
jgi:restriction endonuclease S subunit